MVGVFAAFVVLVAVRLMPLDAGATGQINHIGVDRAPSNIAVNPSTNLVEVASANDDNVSLV